jgi:uncharacterized protein (TIGR02996 family)
MAKVRSPFPDPVCKLPDEYGLVAAVLAAPLDDLPKLVYADWLDERDDPRGAFLRKWLAARKAGKPLPKPYKGLSKCWMSVVGFTLDEWLVKQGHPAWGDAIRATAAPGLVVRAVPLNDGETVPAGQSKMGGLPDLDPELPWPQVDDDSDATEMAFLAQWNLEELAVSPCAARLPKKGLLSFFIDLIPFVEDSGDGKFEIVYTKNAAVAEEQEPSDLWEDNELAACRVEFREWLCIPDNTSPALNPLLSDALRREYTMPYFDYPRAKGSHQILGHAGPIQNDPSPKGKQAWSLLTQFGPDEDLRLEACDGGTWYFMTPDADLMKGKFGGTQMEFQTG